MGSGLHPGRAAQQYEKRLISGKVHKKVDSPQEQAKNHSS
jgi:hypothetical protein